MHTFGKHAAYDDEPWEDHRRGRDAVRDYKSFVEMTFLVKLSSTPPHQISEQAFAADSP